MPPTQSLPEAPAATATGLLAGKRLVVTGVLTRDSIAWHLARRAREEGADVVLTGFGRARRLTERAARSLATDELPAPDVLELDVGSPEDLAAVADELRTRWGHVDGVLHAIAHAPADALGGAFLEAPAASATSAFEVSAYSLKALAVALRPLLERTEEHPGGAIVGLDFDATVAWPSYDWMGVAKAALESVSRYLARDLGPRGVRCNLVAAGPIGTMAARGIPGFGELTDVWAANAPLGWDVEDAAPVADAVAFLLSDLSRAVTGEILHVDGGVHAVGAATPG